MLFWLDIHKENHEFAQQEIFKIRKQLDPCIVVPKNYYTLIILNLVNYYIINSLVV